MGKLFQFKTVLLLLLSAVLVSTFIFPQDVFAWAGIKSKTIGTRDFWPPWKVFTHWDLDTHQMMLEKAHAWLSKDPAFKEQPDVFPKKDDFMQWEGVIAESLVAGYRWGAFGKGGPDASEQSRDAEHYYNPLINRIAKDGNAPQSIERHFRTLLSQMYPLPGSAVKGAKDAAWAAHYLADIFVPFHVIGIPAQEILGEGDGPTRHILTPEEAGGQILWRPKEVRLDADGAVDKNSIVTPQHGWGRDMDFSRGIEYFNEYCAADNYKNLENSDWYDPWYHNGKYVPGTWNSRRATGSHASWEEWAHKYMVGNRLMTVPTEYLSGWENAKPDINLPFNAHLDNQAKQAAAFTIAQAKNTRAYGVRYLKKPELTCNKAIQAIATLWRASLSALKPQVKVEPIEPKGSNRYRVLGTVRNVADEDAINVQAKLKVEGGKIIDASSKTAGIQPVGTLKNIKPAETKWEIETTNIDKCQIEMAVTGNYKDTPDLGYAVATPSTPLKVTVSPDRVEPKKQFTLSVQVEPPQKAELQIQVQPKITLLDENSKEITGPFTTTTKADGKFEGKFMVKEGTAAGKYDIKVLAPKLGQEGTASLRVGKPFEPVEWQHTLCQVAIRCTLGGTTRFSSGITQGTKAYLYFVETFEGSFTGNTFTGKLRPRAGFNGTGDVTIIFEPTEVSGRLAWHWFKVSKYSVKYKVETGGTQAIVDECSASGEPTTEIIFPYTDGSSLFHFPVAEGTDACRVIKARKVVVSTAGGSIKEQTTTIYDNILCSNNDDIRFTFPKVR